MILSGKEIEKNLHKNIIINPYNEKQLNPNSYNVRLHNELLVYKEPVLSAKVQNETKSIEIIEGGLLLEPGQLYLGRTAEYTETKNLVPMLEGRSSCGRLGMFIHVTAGFGDVGFKGFWTLEIVVVKPLTVYPDMEIGQLFYHTISKDHDEYDGKYCNNRGIQPSMMYKDFS